MRIRKAHVRLVGLAILIAALVVLGLALEPARLLDPEALRSTAREHPWEATAVFLLAGLGIKLLFVPFSPLSVVGGLVFGGAIGGTLAFAVLMTASVVAFGLGRGLGRDWVQELVDDEANQLRTVERLLREHGLLAVVVLRIVPTLPLSAVNILLGHSSVRARDFFLGTALGILPGVYALAFLGGEALEPDGPRFWILLGLTLALVLGGVLLGCRLRRRVRP